jgi:hypothetical protein
MMGFGEKLKVSTPQHRAASSGTLSQRILNSILKFDKMPSRAHGCDLGACLLMADFVEKLLVEAERYH